MRDAFRGSTALKHLAPLHYRTYQLLSLPLTMASRRDLSRSQKKPRTSGHKEKGTVRSKVCSTAIRSDPPQ